jgi:hypothetical protein
VYEERGDDWVRVIRSAELWEFSIVPFGMNPEALVDSVKTLSVRDLEGYARDRLGYSQSKAKAYASDVYKSLGHRDDGSDSGTLEDALKTLRKSFDWS